MEQPAMKNYDFHAAMRGRFNVIYYAFGDFPFWYIFSGYLILSQPLFETFAENSISQADKWKYKKKNSQEKKSFLKTSPYIHLASSR